VSSLPSPAGHLSQRRPATPGDRGRRGRVRHPSWASRWSLLTAPVSF